MSGFGAEVIAIEDTDGVGWVEGATTIGEVNFQSASTLVENVLRDLGSRQMSLLHIQAHGTPERIRFGPDRITVSSFPSFSATLARLTAKFTGDAWVDLRACDVGLNLPLLHLFRQLWNVGIVAGRGSQSNLLDANSGFYQIVTREGRETTSFSAPPWVQYDVGRRAVRGITSRLGL